MKEKQSCEVSKVEKRTTNSNICSGECINCPYAQHIYRDGILEAVICRVRFNENGSYTVVSEILLEEKD